MRLATAAETVEFTASMARELAVSQRVCVRPLLRRVEDRATGGRDFVAIPCGSTREAVCPPCANKARLLRMQQCAEGWHRSEEPPAPMDALDRTNGGPDGEDPDDEDDLDDEDGVAGGRRVRSTRRRRDVTDLPRVPAEDRTVGTVFTAADGREFRPSMFLTLTLGSYGPVTATGAPRHSGSYDYRRAALDALHFPKLVDRFWQNLRRCAGFRVQYFAAVEPQRRLAPHLHAALRGAIPRAVLRQVVQGTYVQVWWPPFDEVMYREGGLPVWNGGGYVDPGTGAALPTWREALDVLDADPAARPAHVMRFGSQLDIQGIIAPSEDADRAVRYLTKYLTKTISDAATDVDDPRARTGLSRHADRLYAELRFLPCSAGCANWLRYGVQPDGARPGQVPGACPLKAHDRANLGLGGRRVLVSRQWSGKTLGEHKADRGQVVREALLSAGILAPEVERMAAAAKLPDGSPRFVWSDTEPDPRLYVWVLLASIAERQRWQAQYDAAKATAAARGSVSATDRGS